MPPTRSEEENYNCILKIMNVAVCEGLGEIFKQEWDKQYSTTKGVWDDTAKSGNELYNMERTRRHANPYLNLYQAGKRSEWDCSALFDAILYSNAIKKHLNPHLSNKVDELRKLRNKLTHTMGPKHEISDIEFENAYKKVQNCFKALKLSTACVEKIANSFKGRLVTSFEKMAWISFVVFLVGGLLSCSFYYWLAHPMTKSLFRFRVLPARPVHLVANRSRTVNVILEELHNLSIKNNGSLSYLYISGNPGSGKSQLARLVGQRYDTISSRSSSNAAAFVMTLKGTSLLDILGSYIDFARRVDCIENNIANIMNSSETTTMMKINSLKTEIAKRLQDFKNTWLLIVDNVVKLNEISSALPQLGEEDWQGGQVLITTQDMLSVPPNSSMTVHISVSQGMDPEESFDFLTRLSGLFENQDMVSKVGKELDYQPLAMASAAFYVKELRESKASPHFTWEEYLKKLDEGKRNLTETRLNEVNKLAYSLTMSTAVLLAVELSAESDLVLKHAFTFFSYVSYEAQSLQFVVSYVLRVDKEMDEEHVRLRILQCCLILSSDDQEIVSISLHRIVHDSVKLYIGVGRKKNKNSRVPLYVFLSLMQQKCPVGNMTLIPHLKAFYARSSELFVPDSIKMKQKIHEGIFNWTYALFEHGEFLLSKQYLMLILRIIGDQNERSHVFYPKIGQIYNNLGAVERYLGNIEQSRKYLNKALKILITQHGSSHKNVATTLINLANLPWSNSIECDENLKKSKHALDIHDTMETKATHYSNLGRKSYFDGDFINAEKHYLRAFRILQKILDAPGTKHLVILKQLALVRSNLGAIYYLAGSYTEARRQLTTSIDMYRDVTGPNHLDLAMSFYNLGLVEFKLSNFLDAENNFRSALEIYQQQLEPGHERIALVSLNLAVALESRGQLKEAAKLNEQYGTMPSTCRMEQ